MIDKAIFSLPGVRRMLAIVLVLSIARALAVVGQALGLANAVVNLWGGAALAEQLPWLALFFACFVLRQVLVNAQTSLLDRYSRERAEEMREQLLTAVFNAGPSFVSQLGSASVAQTLLGGIEEIRIYIGLIIPKIIAVVAVPFVLLLAVFSLDWVSGVIALVCYPFIILYMVMIGHTAKDDAAKRHGEFQRMANHFIDGVAGISDLKTFGQSRYYESRIFEASERFRAMTMKTLRIATLSSTVLDLFATLALAGVAVMLGFRLVDGSVAFLPALAVLIMVPEYFRPIREFAADYHASLDGRSSFAALRRLLDGAADLAASTEAGEKGEEGAPAAACEKTGEGAVAGEPLSGGEGAAVGEPLSGGEGAVAGEPLSGGEGERHALAAPRIELRNLGFSYADRADALRDVSFEVQGPCKVGLIGTSGSGKSTLMSILAGFADPSTGGVLLDGRERASLRSEDWHRRVSYIPQDPYVFSATLRENVAFYKPSASEAEIMRAVSLAGLDELVARLPQGLDTMVGNGGEGSRGLSGGQAHRLALARSFLCGDRPVLLLDEPTAHLDIETELELKERMLPLMEGKLVIFATHRLHWVKQMDYVVELHAGRVVWQGSSADWLDRAREGRGL